MEFSAVPLLLLCACLPMCTRAESVTGSGPCYKQESYNATVEMLVTMQVNKTKYDWCLGGFMRCPVFRLENVDRLQNVTQVHTRNVETCCPGTTPTRPAVPGVNVSLNCVPITTTTTTTTIRPTTTTSTTTTTTTTTTTPRPTTRSTTTVATTTPTTTTSTTTTTTTTAAPTTLSTTASTTPFSPSSTTTPVATTTTTTTSRPREVCRAGLWGKGCPHECLCGPGVACDQDTGKCPRGTPVLTTLPPSPPTTRSRVATVSTISTDPSPTPPQRPASVPEPVVPVTSDIPPPPRATASVQIDGGNSYETESFERSGHDSWEVTPSARTPAVSFGDSGNTPDPGPGPRPTTTLLEKIIVRPVTETPPAASPYPYSRMAITKMTTSHPANFEESNKVPDMDREKNVKSNELNITKKFDSVDKEFAVVKTGKAIEEGREYITEVPLKVTRDPTTSSSPTLSFATSTDSPPPEESSSTRGWVSSTMKLQTSTIGYFAKPTVPLTLSTRGETPTTVRITNSLVTGRSPSSRPESEETFVRETIDHLGSKPKIHSPTDAPHSHESLEDMDVQDKRTTAQLRTTSFAPSTSTSPRSETRRHSAPTRVPELQNIVRVHPTASLESAQSSSTTTVGHPVSLTRPSTPPTREPWTTSVPSTTRDLQIKTTEHEEFGKYQTTTRRVHHTLPSASFTRNPEVRTTGARRTSDASEESRTPPTVTRFSTTQETLGTSRHTFASTTKPPTTRYITTSTKSTPSPSTKMEQSTVREFETKLTSQGHDSQRADPILGKSTVLGRKLTTEPSPHFLETTVRWQNHNNAGKKSAPSTTFRHLPTTVSSLLVEAASSKELFHSSSRSLERMAESPTRAPEREAKTASVQPAFRGDKTTHQHYQSRTRATAPAPMEKQNRTAWRPTPSPTPGRTPTTMRTPTSTRKRPTISVHVHAEPPSRGTPASTRHPPPPPPQGVRTTAAPVRRPPAPSTHEDGRGTKRRKPVDYEDEEEDDEEDDEGDDEDDDEDEDEDEEDSMEED